VVGFASHAHALTRLRLELDERERGRIMPLWSISFLGPRPLASLADGASAAGAGVRVAGCVLALSALAAGLVWLRARRYYG
jgi:hypothetical protein